MVEHKKEFPKCGFIFNDGYNVGNIPIVKQNPEISTSDVEILDNDAVVELPDKKLELKNYKEDAHNNIDSTLRCEFCDRIYRGKYAEKTLRKHIGAVHKEPNLPDQDDVTIKKEKNL